MVMVCVERRELAQKIRRMLGKCHVGLIHSKKTNQLLESIDKLVSLPSLALVALDWLVAVRRLSGNE